MRAAFLALFAFIASDAAAEVVLAARTIRAQEIIAPGDLIIGRGSVPGTHDEASDLVGLEARAILYAGRPVRIGDLGPPALVSRNQRVALSYDVGGLSMRAEGRALDRGAAGEIVRVMNTASRITITGTVLPDGTIAISR